MTVNTFFASRKHWALGAFGHCGEAEGPPMVTATMPEAGVACSSSESSKSGRLNLAAQYCDAGANSGWIMWGVFVWVRGWVG